LKTGKKGRRSQQQKDKGLNADKSFNELLESQLVDFESQDTRPRGGLVAASALAAPVEGTFEGANLADKLFTISESNRRISELSRGPAQRTASNRVVPPPSNSKPADGRFNYGSTSKHTH